MLHLPIFCFQRFSYTLLGFNCNVGRVMHVHCTENIFTRIDKGDGRVDCYTQRCSQGKRRLASAWLRRRRIRGFPLLISIVAEHWHLSHALTNCLMPWLHHHIKQANFLLTYLAEYVLFVARSQRGQHKTQLKGMKNNDFLLTPSLPLSPSLSLFPALLLHVLCCCQHIRQLTAWTELLCISVSESAQSEIIH